MPMFVLLFVGDGQLVCFEVVLFQQLRFCVNNVTLYHHFEDHT
jgi:hypothetical protein